MKHMTLTAEIRRLEDVVDGTAAVGDVRKTCMSAMATLIAIQEWSVGHVDEDTMMIQIKRGRDQVIRRLMVLSWKGVNEEAGA